MVDGTLNQDLLACLERHAEKCPQTATTVGHELSISELMTRRPKAVMVSARLDGVWMRDGLLDCRDYKTGKSAFSWVQDNIAARVQTFALWGLAQRLGLRLRLRYEHIGDTADDPEPFEPDEDDIESIADEISTIASDIAGSDFSGDPDPLVCVSCPYQLACPESAGHHEIEIEVVDLSDVVL